MCSRSVFDQLLPPLLHNSHKIRFVRVYIPLVFGELSLAFSGVGLDYYDVEGKKHNAAFAPNVWEH